MSRKIGNRSRRRRSGPDHRAPNRHGAIRNAGTVAALLAGLTADALAQDQPAPAPAPPSGGEEGQPAPGSTVVVVPGPQPPPQVIVPGYPPPGTNVDAHLPSSSRTSSDTSK